MSNKKIGTNIYFLNSKRQPTTEITRKFDADTTAMEMHEHIDSAYYLSKYSITKKFLMKIYRIGYKQGLQARD